MPEHDELFYRNGLKWMAVAATTGRTFSAGRPRRLFEGPYPKNRYEPGQVDAIDFGCYGISPDPPRRHVSKRVQVVAWQVCSPVSDLDR